ncbi:hypothetical protein DN752_21395 [Echinicola strongylocentroti]|uniref:Uncharacterized protein n=1 Tax=Echinicola strongylocentroti TaxID=1795355 RepID=A0A2Z4INY7_9BACT|nr:hypothetical protein [Echinicola strongylocentroti]AWW32497.1 hypothetical protein DN752_21395 [Echinicola strongylocentroti]
MAAAISGKTRHLFYADGYFVGLTVDASFGGAISTEAGGLLITRGDDKGWHILRDKGAGMISDIQVSGGIEVSKFYFTGSVNDLNLYTFGGLRGEANLNLTLLPFVSAGVTGSYANVKGGKLFSLGNTISIGASALEFLFANVGLNYGQSTVQYGNK